MNDYKFWSKDDISFKQYLTNVLADQPKRMDDLEVLINFFGTEYIDDVMSGKKEFTSDDLTKAKA